MLALSLLLQPATIALDQVVAVIAPVGLQLPMLQGEDRGDRLVEQGEVVGHDQHPASIGGEPLDQPGFGVEVEMVRRLVEQEDIGLGEEDSGQFHPAALATGHGDHRLVQLVVPDPESSCHPLRLCFGNEPALRLELLMETAEAGDSPIPLHAVEVMESVSGLFDPALQGPDLSRHEDPLQRRGVGMLQLGEGCLLGEVANASGTENGAFNRSERAGERPHQGGLAGAVPTHQADAIT